MEKKEASNSKDTSDYHCKDALEICKELGTDPEEGLASSCIAERRKQYGDNKLPEPKRASKIKLLDFMVIILVVSAGVSAAFQDYKAAIVLLIVVVINIAIGFTEELKADNALANLLSSRLSEQDCYVTRDGHVANIKSAELVVGDLVNLEEGDQVAADLRLIQLSHLQIDESTLTGESVSVDKNLDIIEDRSTPLADRKNMAYMMTLVSRGRGMGVVVRAGITTEVGKSSAAMEQDNKRKKTNLQQKLSKLGKWLVLLAVILCGIVTGLGVKNGNDLKQMVETGVSLAVSVIPEGLVAVTTVTMAIGVQQMAKRKAIVRQLPAVEVLGAVSVICSDKTGTLTEGKMKAEQIWIGGESYFLSGRGIVPEGTLCKDKEYKQPVEKKSEGLEKLLLVCSLCNNASVYKGDEVDEDLMNNGRSSQLERRNSQAPRRSGQIERRNSQQRERRNSQQTERRNSQIQKERESKGKEKVTWQDQHVVNIISDKDPLLPKERKSPTAIDSDTRRGSMSRRASITTRRKSVSIPKDKDNGWKTVGTPTEIALQVAAMKAGYGKEALEDKGWDFIRDIPFDSSRKRMSVVYKSPEGQAYAFSKGAAEYLIPQCTQFSNGSQIIPFSQAEKDLIEKQSLALSESGMRVLALAFHQWEGDLQTDEETIEKDMCFLGLIGLMDPPRKQVGPSIEECHKAGIKVVMITGDNPITAESIAKDLNLLSAGQDKSVYMKTGAELDALSDEALATLNPFPSVFARVSPEAKLRIVNALQKQDRIVAFIGDGVNDAASIKRADVGVAMGITGTDVSQQSADIILSDDNFKHIITAVEEGRRIYDNIFKFTTYLLSCNSAEIFIMLICTALNEPTPFTAIQILFATDVPPSMSLGIEPVEQDAMQKKPRDPHDAFFGKITALVVTLQGMSMSALCTLAFLEVLHKESMDIVHARCLVFTMLVVIQLWHSFLSKSFTRSIFSTGLISNKWLIGAFFLSFACLIGGTYIPGLNQVLDLVPLNAWDWAKIGGAVVVHTIIVELMKVGLRFKARRDARKREEKFEADNLHV